MNPESTHPRRLSGSVLVKRILGKNAEIPNELGALLFAIHQGLSLRDVSLHNLLRPSNVTTVVQLLRLDCLKFRGGSLNLAVKLLFAGVVGCMKQKDCEETNDC